MKTLPSRRFSHRGTSTLTAVLLASLVADHAFATVRYVDANSTNATPPYTNWASAAATIQQAADAAAPGDEIVVTNGVYATGGRAVGTGDLVNRVAVQKPLTLRSVNGPEFTIIQGYKASGSTDGCGDGAIRCVYLADGASLSGFTLTNGATRAGAVGDFAESNAGGGVWCASINAVVTDCVVTGNSALNQGGGACGGTLNHCTLAGNSARNRGGGAYDCTLNNCTLTGNSAWFGGGALGGTLNNCEVSGNSASYGGGGASQGTLNNCTVTGNSAATCCGGGVFDCTLNNSIVYFNTATAEGPNYVGSILNCCCTTPLPPEGAGNVVLDPKLASASHLSADSPCRGAGNADYATGADIDGETWAIPPSIGCDEYLDGQLTGPLSVGIAATYTNVAVGFSVELTALITGRTSASEWEFGDGVVVSNQPYATHAWMAAGDYRVRLRAYNESHPEAVSATWIVHVVEDVHYVATDSPKPLAPYNSWATAARNIQDAVDVAVPGALVLVTNGTYATGGRAVVDTETNRVAVDKPLMVRSVNGPQFTIIKGFQVPGADNFEGSIRCVYLANGASLSGFTLTNGAAWSGGGVWCESILAVATNCTLTGNSGFYGGGASGGTLNNCTLTGNSASYGGGASGGILNNCRLTGNSASRRGGGASGDGPVVWLNNCTLTGNSASSGGGVAAGDIFGHACLNNCIIYFNTATEGADNCSSDWALTLNYCCTTPMPTNGVGNITNAPLFVDYAGGNLRLESNSPCINAGNNSYLTDSDFTNLFDLDGLPRIVSGTVDIGAYEFQGPGSMISYAWLQQYDLPTDGSVDAADADADGHNTWQEWRCLTDPTNALSALRLLAASPTGTNVTVSWQSVAGVNYSLERSTSLSASPPFTLLAPNLPGQPGTTTFTDTDAVRLGPRFYRVRRW
ncbi:MAG: PKD domain-containing protein [Verrucomicrobia bacterium]|nr:PKD domain-containing protein [Verrucomicrobiota bacterium]